MIPGAAFLGGCIANALNEFQSSAVVSPDFDVHKSYIIAILPPDYTSSKPLNNKLQVLYESQGDEDLRADEVFIDGQSAGSVDWVDNSFTKLNISPGYHTVSVAEFMGDTIASGRFHINDGEQLVLKVSAQGVYEVSRTRFQTDSGQDLRGYLLNYLTKEAMAAGLTPVERSKIDAVLKEQEFSYSGVVDPSRAVQLGKLLGAEMVLVCQASESFDYDFGNYLITLWGRMIDVSTGQVVYAVRARSLGFTREYAIEQASSNFFKALRQAKSSK